MVAEAIKPVAGAIARRAMADTTTTIGTALSPTGRTVHALHQKYLPP
jgi:hypothetical protein